MSRLEIVLRNAGRGSRVCTYKPCPSTGTRSYYCTDCALSYTNEEKRKELFKELLECHV